MAKFEVKEYAAIITGSAQGFGKEIATRLLSEGAKVCLSDKNEELGMKTFKKLKEIYGVDTVTFQRYYF